MYVCVCVCVCRPACRRPCCRAAAGPGRQERWWTETDSAAAVGSAARECTPTPGDRDRESSWFIYSFFFFYHFSVSNVVCQSGVWILTFSSAALALVLFLISSHGDKVIQWEARNVAKWHLGKVQFHHVESTTLSDICINWLFYIRNDHKNALYGQNYVDTWTLQLYVIDEHLIPKPWALPDSTLLVSVFQLLLPHGRQSSWKHHFSASLCLFNVRVDKLLLMAFYSWRFHFTYSNVVALLSSEMLHAPS